MAEFTHRRGNTHLNACFFQLGAELGVGAGEHDVEELEVVEAAVEVDVEELHQVVALALGSVGSVVAQEVQDID